MSVGSVGGGFFAQRCESEDTRRMDVSIGPANNKMEPTRLTVHAIMAPRRAAHFARWADGERCFVTEQLLVARPTTGGFSWTLASRFGQMLP